MMVSALRKLTDPNRKVEIIYKLSGKGNNEAWRWSAYSWGTKKHTDRRTGEESTLEGYIIFRCMGPPQGFAIYYDAVADSQELLNVTGE